MRRSWPGLKHLVADRVLANMLVGFGLTMLVLGFCEASIYALLDAFDKPATYAGVFVTIQGVGAIAGGLSAGRLIRRIGEVAASALGLVILALTMLGIAVARDLVFMLACAGRDGHLPAAADDRLPHAHPEAHAAGPDGPGLDRGRGGDVGAGRGLPGASARPWSRSSTTG